MSVGISFTMCSFFFIVLLAVVFFSKKRFISFENKIYSYLILTSLFGTMIGVPCYYFMKDYELFGIFNIITSKAYLVYLVMWLMLFTSYIFTISVKNIDRKKIFKYTVYLSCILLLGVIALPLYYHSKNGLVYSYGPSTNLMYLVSGFFLIIVFWCLFKNIKYITQKKFIPIIAFLLVGMIIMIIQKLNPGLLLLTFGEAFITFLMYFTIENPDLQMIDELYKNKMLVEQSYEDKSNFLFEMTQEVRDPLFNITNISNEIVDESDVQKLRNGVKAINSSVKQLDFIVNDVLDVTSLDAQKIKLVNSRYNINNLYNEIVSKIKSCVPNSIEFRTNITNNIPYLYGDSIKLKQIVLSILLNAVKKTESGYIEFNVNTIEKYDVCRLIVTITDSGGGISIEKINEILSVTGELNQNDIKNMEKMEINMQLAQKIIKLLGGNLMIKSNRNIGTEVVLTLDQRTYKEKQNNIFEEYEFYINSSKNVLVVTQRKDILSIIKRKLNENNITISTSLYGRDSIDKIKSGKKYSYIIIDDEMKELSGYTTLSELKKIDNFDIPVIILLEDNKLNIKNEYIKDGFNDIIEMKNIREELDRIIEKY